MKTDFIVDQKLNLSASTLTLPGGSVVKSTLLWKRCRFYPWVGRISWRRNGNPLRYSAWKSWTEEHAGGTVHGVTKTIRHD